MPVQPRALRVPGAAVQGVPGVGHVHAMRRPGAADPAAHAGLLPGHHRVRRDAHPARVLPEQGVFGAGLGGGDHERRAAVARAVRPGLRAAGVLQVPEGVVPLQRRLRAVPQHRPRGVLPRGVPHHHVHRVPAHAGQAHAPLQGHLHRPHLPPGHGDLRGPAVQLAGPGGRHHAVVQRVQLQPGAAAARVPHARVRLLHALLHHRAGARDHRLLPRVLHRHQGVLRVPHRAHDEEDHPQGVAAGDRGRHRGGGQLDGDAAHALPPQPRGVLQGHDHQDLQGRHLADGAAHVPRHAHAAGHLLHLPGQGHAAVLRLRQGPGQRDLLPGLGAHHPVLRLLPRGPQELAVHQVLLPGVHPRGHVPVRHHRAVQHHAVPGAPQAAAPGDHGELRVPVRGVPPHVVLLQDRGAAAAAGHRVVHHAVQHARAGD
mmetsp:Transcript_16105/g.39247  ORF Transcript_16105/g.39247 Transcript_16105/m.39247 type:complete len:428 (-) Transcript_16105:1472-2755(-)